MGGSIRMNEGCRIRGRESDIGGTIKSSPPSLGVERRAVDKVQERFEVEEDCMRKRG